MSSNLFSLILVILAGIALRYALWYGKDDVTHVVDGESDSLRERNRSLRAELDAGRSDIDRVNGEYDKLQERCESLTAALAERDSVIFETRQSGSAELEEMRLSLAGLQKENEGLRSDRTNGLNIQAEKLAEEKRQLEARIAELSSQVEDLQSGSDEMESLKAELQQSEAAYDNAARELADSLEAQEKLEGQLDVMRSSHEQFIADVKQIRTGHDGLSTELAESNRVRDELLLMNEELSEKHLNAARESEAQMQAVLESHEESDAQMKGLLAEARDQIELLTAEARLSEDLRSEQGHLKMSLHESANRLRTIHGEHETMSAELSESRGRIAQMQDTIEDQNRQMQHYASELSALGDRADERVAEMKNSYERNISSLHSAGERKMEEVQVTHDRQLAELRSDYEKQMSDLAAKYQSQFVEHETDLNQRLESAVADASRQTEQLRAENQSLIERVEATADSTSRLGEITVESNEIASERDGLATQLSTARQQIGQLEDRMETLQASSASHNDAIRATNTEKQELLNGLHREQEERIRLEKLLAEMELKTANYQTVSVEVSQLRERCADLDGRLGEKLVGMERLESERETINASLIHAQRRVEELSGSVTRFERDVASRESMIRKLTHEKENIGTQLEMERSERNRLEEMLRVHVETLEQLRVDSNSLESLLERQTIVQQSLQEHAENLRTVAGVTEQVIESSGPQILSMRGLDAEEEIQVTGDDLKKISGIGEVLEQKLYSQGITTWQQIASWSAEDVESFARSLQWDRIEADEWVDQASHLFEEMVRSRLRAA